MSMILLLILSPIFLVLAIWIKIDSQGPVFYRQERVTQYGKIFRIFKFRTMISNADQIGALVTTQNDTRITKVGDMSFVGTRPEVRKYVDAYTDEMKATLLLPAGVTSSASISYRDEDEVISKYVDNKHSIDDVYIEKILPEKMKYNLNYFYKYTLAKDLILCVKTIL